MFKEIKIEEIIQNAPSYLQEFTELYKKKPIQDNTGGMKTPHMFWVWLIAKLMQPPCIIESGVFMGQGTWFFRKACPTTRLICIEPRPEQIQYYDRENSSYHKRDFSTLDYSAIDVSSTLCFFDDHQNALDRVRQCKMRGFYHLMFEDNYPASQGDCYSLKKAFMGAGFSPHNIAENTNDADWLRKNLQEYYEVPPIFKTSHTRWRDLWQNPSYPTPKPLLTSVEHKYQQLYKDEAKDYTWLCYAKLK